MFGRKQWWTQSAALLIGLGSLVAASCGGDKNDTNTGAAGGTGNTAGAAPQAGETAAGGAAPVCVLYATKLIPPNGRITDFSEVTDGTYDDDNKFEWGNDQSLTGGVFWYVPEGNTNLTTTVTGGLLHLTGTIPAGDYAGFGLWFGPACNDARAFTGISLTVYGTAGEAEIQFQVQSSRNYPTADDNSKGECTGSWSDGCSNNRVVLVGYGDAASTIQIPFTDLTGGEPIAPLEPAELLGIQWEFRCGEEADCTPDFNIDDVQFY